MFELFDPNDELDIRQGSHLPHWFQAGVTYFVTFRTDDSIPAHVRSQWYRRRDDWLQRHGIHPKNPGWKSSFQNLSIDLRREFHDTFSKEFLDYLDRGYGECVLKRPELAKIVGDSLLHFDGGRYHMGDFVVMPNHVHLLVCLLQEVEIEAQCYSWKKFTAGKINRALGTSGRFWQEESFDHLVRITSQFEAIQRYIATNPANAGLRPGEFLYSQRPK